MIQVVARCFHSKFSDLLETNTDKSPVCQEHQWWLGPGCGLRVWISLGWKASKTIRQAPFTRKDSCSWPGRASRRSYSFAGQKCGPAWTGRKQFKALQGISSRNGLEQPCWLPSAPPQPFPLADWATPGRQSVKTVQLGQAMRAQLADGRLMICLRNEGNAGNLNLNIATISYEGGKGLPAPVRCSHFAPCSRVCGAHHAGVLILKFNSDLSIVPQETTTIYNCSRKPE